MLSVIMLSVIMLSVVMARVLAPKDDVLVDPSGLAKDSN